LELGGSLPIEIPVYDWSSLLGSLDSWQGLNYLHDVFEELGINKDLSIALANPEVIRTLGRSWYTTRRVLFVEDTIDATDFREALLHWQHEQQLVK